MTEVIRKLQQVLKDEGFYKLDVDGKWGNGSRAALEAALSAKETKMQIAWGKKVSLEFVEKVKSIVKNLGMPDLTGPSDLMTCIAWESGGTFSPSVVNKAGSGATGLIQFMPATAIVYFNTDAEIAKMSAEQKKAAGLEACKRLAAMSALEQLDYVERYFRPYKGRLKNLGDLYLSILWPAGIGKPDTYVLWDNKSRPTTYRQNSGLDVNKDGAITRAECLIKLNGMLAKGLESGNVLIQ